MSEKNEGMPLVPEEDLDLHQNFQPIIAENGLIRPKKLPDDLTISPDTTFTRMDTVQDLVQIRSAEQKAKEEAKKQDVDPQAAPEAQPQPQAETSVQMQTVKAEPFAPEVPPTQPEPPAKPVSPNVQPQAPAQPDLPAQPQPEFQTLTPSLAQDELPPDLPTIPFAQPVSKKRKSKKERRKQKEAPKNEEKQIPPTSSTEQPVVLLPALKKRRRWVWLLLILCLLLLGTIGGIVPVENIPFLRNIAYAMGFSKDDTSRMSFLRTLLAWKDKGKKSPDAQQGTDEQSSSGHLMALERLRTQRGDPSASEEEDLGSLYSRMQHEGGKTGLIDIQALNEFQRQKGYKVDSIRGASMYFDPEKEPEAASLRDDNVNVRTEANQSTGEVFFGSDAFSVGRGAQDGFDSVNGFKKIANPHIAGVNSVDWFTMTAQRMMKTDMGLGGVNKEFSAMHLDWGTNLNSVGKNKEHRDLYSAWIASRMSKYTPNLMVKKALADTGFMGAEVPTTASNVVGLGGILLDTDSLKEDQAEWQEYLEFKKQCEKALEDNSQAIDDAVNEYNKIWKYGAQEFGYPEDCYQARNMTEVPDAIQTNSARVEGICTTLKIKYKDLADKCDMRVANAETDCTGISDGYKTSFADFKNKCNSLYQDKKTEWESDPAHEGVPYSDTQWKIDGEKEKYAKETLQAQTGGYGKTFATWIRAKCTEEGAGINCIPVNEMGIEDWGQIKGVRDTIGGHILRP